MEEEERINNIKAALNHVHEWPSIYIFKFIVPTVSDKFELLRKLFPVELDIYTRMSENGKYTSVTIKETMLSAEEVLEIYSKVNDIGGIVSL